MKLRLALCLLLTHTQVHTLPRNTYSIVLNTMMYAGIPVATIAGAYLVKKELEKKFAHQAVSCAPGSDFTTQVHQIIKTMARNHRNAQNSNEIVQCVCGVLYVYLQLMAIKLVQNYRS